MIMKCGWCNSDFELRNAEYNRQNKRNGRTTFYCSRECSARAINKGRGFTQNEVIVKICPYCGSEFETLSGSRESTFCSRACASFGSITEARLEGARRGGRKSSILNFGINFIAAGMKKREAWRYKEVESFLDFQKEPHEFEYVLGRFIYDLALTDRKILIEFDEEYHSHTTQREIDSRKSEFAVMSGWRIDRIPSRQSKIISPGVMYKYFS